MAIRRKNGTRKSSRKAVQQGDCCIERIAAIPAGVKHRDGLVLAEGEATGHAHRVVPSKGAKAELYGLGERLFLRILDGDCRVIHEEHGQQTLTPGDYEVARVLEYDYDKEEARQVVD